MEDLDGVEKGVAEVDDAADQVGGLQQRQHALSKRWEEEQAAAASATAGQERAVVAPTPALHFDLNPLEGGSSSVSDDTAVHSLIHLLSDQNIV